MSDTQKPAASAWRTDVENAPLGVQLLCWQWTPEGCDWHQIVMRRNANGYWDCGEPYCEHDAPIAFATINPPQLENSDGPE